MSAFSPTRLLRGGTGRGSWADSGAAGVPWLCVPASRRVCPVLGIGRAACRGGVWMYAVVEPGIKHESDKAEGAAPGGAAPSGEARAAGGVRRDTGAQRSTVLVGV